MTKFETILHQIEALPSSPHILPKLLTALNDPDTDTSRVVDLIAYDPGLTTRVLKLYNSAAGGGATPVSDIAQAVNRVGLQAIYRMVAVASGRAALRPRQPIVGLQPEVLWKHAVTTALAAQLMAQDLQDDVSAVFTAALLHDAGMLVMAEAFNEPYTELLTQSASLYRSTRAAGMQAALSLAERAAFGIDGAEAGGRLLTCWKFPASMAAAVTFHLRPAEAGDAKHLAAYVHLGDVLAQLLEAPPTNEIQWSPATADALDILKLPSDAILRYRDRTLENFEFVNGMCRL